MRITRADLQALWCALTGDAVVNLVVVSERAPYWGQVRGFAAAGGLCRVELRRDLLSDPQELMRTYFHEMAHRLRGDTQPARRPPGPPLAALLALQVEAAVREPLAERNGEMLLDLFAQAIGHDWARVVIDIT